ncbi:transcription factor TFIIIB component b'' [Cryptococcus gattii E566]|nr:transcription factor TFIIIB component b'' [Cryptococcus gattii E566]
MAMAVDNGTAASTPRATSDDAHTYAGPKRDVAVLDLVNDDIEQVSAPGSVAPSSRAGSLAPAGGGRIKRAKKSHGPRVATIALVDVEPEEMVGSPVTEQTTMGDLATVLVSEGRVSSRAIKIDEFRRAEMLQKKQDAQRRAEEMWRRNQIKRRKVRAAQNKERARKREQLRVQGGGGEMEMDDVSPDEMDSDEEFHVAPDRLTPPRSSSEEAHHPVAAPDFHHDDEEQVDQADEEFENMFDNNNARPDDQDVNALQEDEQDDEAMAALRAAGFTITDDPASPLSDDDNHWDDPNGGMGETFDVADYRFALQERRLREFREREQDDGDVVEVDDETRFVNSATYGKNRKSQRWSKMETELFYEILGETGENYTLMKAYFPGRDIRSLRLKGARENKVNPEKMTAAIMARKPLDKDYLAKSAGYDASRSWDKEEALFEEAKANVERLRKLDSEQPLGKDVSHQDQDEPHHERDRMRLDDDEQGLQRIEEVDVDVEEEEEEEKSEDENDEYEPDEYV